MQGPGLVYPMLQKKQGDCSLPSFTTLLLCSSVLFSWLKTISVGSGSLGEGGLSESHFPAVPSCAPYRGASPCDKAFGRLPSLLSCQASLWCLLWSPQNPGSMARFCTQEVVLKDMSVDLRRARATEGCWIVIPYSPMNHAPPPPGCYL